MAESAYDISDFVPGGWQPMDRLSRITNDGTCSRCLKKVPEDQVPLMFWINGHDLLIYCMDCIDIPQPPRGSDGQ